MTIGGPNKLPIVVYQNNSCFLVSVDPMDPDNHSILHDFFKLRNETFIEKLDWSDLVSAGGAEVDEYDTDTAEYLLLLSKSDRSILAGMRVGQTNDEYYASALSDNPTSYMIRDAFLGRLGTIPAGICFSAPPTNAKTVELTRLISTKAEHLRTLITESSRYLAYIGVAQCLILASPTFLRLGKMLGFEPKAIGPIQGVGKQRYVAMSYNPNTKWS